MWGLFTKETRGQKYGATVPFILERGPNESKNYRYSIEKTDLTVLSRQSWPGCPVLAVLYWQSYVEDPVPGSLFCMTSSACPGSLVLHAIFCLPFCLPYSSWSCSGSPFLAVLFWLTVLSSLFCLSCRFPVILLRLSCSTSIVWKVLCWQSCSDCLILALPSACLIPAFLF